MLLGLSCLNVHAAHVQGVSASDAGDAAADGPLARTAPDLDAAAPRCAGEEGEAEDEPDARARSARPLRRRSLPLDAAAALPARAALSALSSCAARAARAALAARSSSSKSPSRSASSEACASGGAGGGASGGEASWATTGSRMGSAIATAATETAGLEPLRFT